MILWMGVPRADVQLLMQMALWQIPTPDLRGVAVGVRNDAIAADFHYDGPVTELHRDLVSDAETELIAALPRDVMVRFTAISTPAPGPLALGDLSWWMFLRWEPTAE